MKASIGALLIGLAGTSTLLAQTSPAYKNLAPQTPAASAPLPPMPAFLSMPARVGTQALGVSMPPPPLIGSVTVDEKPNKFDPKDPGVVYTDQFEPPIPEPTISFGEPTEIPSGPRYWMSVDFLYWWVQRAPNPQPLVVTGPQTDAFPGALDQPGTRVLYGGKSLEFNPYHGLRLSLGLWFGPDHRLGFEMAGFVTSEKSNSYQATGNAFGNPYLARPFINARTGFENVYFVSQNFDDPARSAAMIGGVNISTTSRIWSWEINGLYNFARNETFAASLIGGFRSVGFNETLHFQESIANINSAGALTLLGAPVPPGVFVTTVDRFNAMSAFYGGQLGSRVHFQRGNCGLDLSAKAAIGVIHQELDIQGSSGIFATRPEDRIGAPGGVYAVSSNIGKHTRNRFGVVPEGNIEFSYGLSDNVVLKAGYSFLYMTSVLRPGNQIDRTVNPGLVPTDIDYGTPGGPARPTFQLNGSSVWVQGVNLGVEVRY